MPFTKELPTWLKTGTKPPDTTLNTTGWKAGDKPPADWLNWFQSTAFFALQELQQKAIHEDQKGANNGVASLGPDGKLLESQRPPVTPVVDGTTTTKGIVQLEDSTTSSSTTKAATPNSIRLVKDKVDLLEGSFNAHKNDYKAHLLYNATSGTANNYVITPAVPITSYAAIEGVSVGIKVHVDNTGASTINISGKGAVPVLNSKGNQLPAGTFKAGIVYTLKGNGTSFILQGEGGELSDLDLSNFRTAVIKNLNA